MQKQNLDGFTPFVYASFTINFTLMSNVTLEGIANLLEEEFKPIKSTLAEHTRILSSHTGALDTLLSKKKTKEDENTVSSERFDRLEHWAQEVGQKLGIKLDL